MALFWLPSSFLHLGKIQEYYISDPTTLDYTPSPSCERFQQTASCKAYRPRSLSAHHFPGQGCFVSAATKGARATSTPVSSRISAPISAIRSPTRKVSSSVLYPTST